VPLSEAVPGPGVGKLWARRRIAEIEVASTLGTMEEQAAADAIARLGLDFSLVSRETSLVAVDRTPARPRGARLTREELPLNLPHGWDFDTLFNGNDGHSAAAAPQEALQELDLPQTGTDAWMLIRNGAALLLLALAGLLVLRRRKPACA
jgi:Ca-activated chloride channel family protein